MTPIIGESTQCLVSPLSDEAKAKKKRKKKKKRSSGVGEPAEGGNDDWGGFHSAQYEIIFASSFETLHASHQHGRQTENLKTQTWKWTQVTKFISFRSVVAARASAKQPFAFVSLFLLTWFLFGFCIWYLYIHRARCCSHAHCWIPRFFYFLFWSFS